MRLEPSASPPSGVDRVEQAAVVRRDRPAARCRAGSQQAGEHDAPPAPATTPTRDRHARSSPVAVGGSASRARPPAAGQLDHEAGARLAVGAVLDPDPPAVHADVLVDEGQPEPGALAAAAPAGGDAAGEALEDQRPLLDGHAGAVVLDGDLDVGQRLVGQVGVGDRDLRLAAAVGAGVVDQVGDDAGQAAAVAADDRPARPRS